MKMTIEQLRAELKKIANGESNGGTDPEDNHINADSLLLKFINDKEVSEIWSDIDKYYA